MGSVILSNGVSVSSKKVKGSVLYENLIEDIMNPKYNAEKKSKLLNIISDIKIFRSDIGTYVQELLKGQVEDCLRNSATKMLEIYFKT